MPVTVAQIMKLDCLAQARVLAGGPGLSRPVSSVTVGEVPDIADWLSGGEHLLVNGASDLYPGFFEGGDTLEEAVDFEVEHTILLRLDSCAGSIPVTLPQPGAA